MLKGAIYYKSRPLIQHCSKRLLMLSLRVDRIKPQPFFCSAFDMGSNKEAEGQQKNDGQTPESTNRNHIAASMTLNTKSSAARAACG